MGNAVAHPNHYNQSGFECIDMVRYLPFSEGNAVKYIHRHRDKGKPVEDLRKSLFYLKDAKQHHLLTQIPRHIDFPDLGRRYCNSLRVFGLSENLISAVDEILFGDLQLAANFVQREIDSLSR